MNPFKKKKYVHCPICIGKRKYIALMLSSTQIYEVKSLSQQHLAGFQTKAICFQYTNLWNIESVPTKLCRFPNQRNMLDWGSCCVWRTILVLLKILGWWYIIKYLGEIVDWSIFRYRFDLSIVSTDTISRYKPLE